MKPPNAEISEFIWRESSLRWFYTPGQPGETLLNALQLAWHRVYNVNLGDLPEPTQYDPGGLVYMIDPLHYVFVWPEKDNVQIREIQPFYLLEHGTKYENGMFPSHGFRAQDDSSALAYANSVALQRQIHPWWLQRRLVGKME